MDSIDKGLELDLKRYVPLSKLKELTTKWEGEEVTSRTKDELIHRLHILVLKQHGDKKDDIMNEITQLLTEYKFAGKRAISWSIPTEELNHITNLVTYIQECFTNYCDINPFEHEIHPAVGNIPMLNKAEWLNEDLLKLQYVYAGRTRIIEEGYEPKEYRPTIRSNVSVRLMDDSFVIECRGNFQIARKLHKITSQILHIDVDIISFSDEDIEAIKRMLNGKKKGARHKRSGGDFDTVQVTAALITEDLDESQEYCKKFQLKQDEIREARFKIPSALGGGSESFTLCINKNGSIWFMSPVSEDVVNYVFYSIRKVKGF